MIRPRKVRLPSPYTVLKGRVAAVFYTYGIRVRRNPSSAEFSLKSIQRSHVERH